MATLGEKIKNLSLEIEEACKSSQKNPKEINLIAVSKTFEEKYIQEVYDYGIRDFGENKVQELVRKYDYFASKGIHDIRWHLIGHLQTNKVKKLIGKATLIHSVDNLNLAKEINKYSEKENITTDILVQVNISGEESKSGVSFNECINLIEECSKLNYIHINGLMGIAENAEDRDIIRQNFKDLKVLYNKISKLNFPSVDMKYLSMGMSNDFNIAIEEGSNVIRVGKKIFGERNYNN